MATSDFTETALFEHRFWLQILGDHSRFICDSLSPRETREVERANRFIRTFDNLLGYARDGTGKADVQSLTEAAFRATTHLREFKLHLLRRHLAQEIGLQLPPTFLNHMVNELEEYLRILTCLRNQQLPPPVHPIHHHLLWLADAAGHSATLANMSDPVEKQIVHKSDQFTMHFEGFYLKAVEVAGFLRTNVERFPALSRFNREVELEIRLFSDFLHEIEEMELSDTVLGSLSPLLPDHMAREECYYLTKLAEVSEITPPNCNPASPRREKE